MGNSGEEVPKFIGKEDNTRSVVGEDWLWPLSWGRLPLLWELDRRILAATPMLHGISLSSEERHPKEDGTARPGSWTAERTSDMGGPMGNLEDLCWARFEMTATLYKSAIPIPQGHWLIYFGIPHHGFLREHL